MTARIDHCSNRRPPGFTLIEVVIATLVTSVLLVAALNTVGAARTSEFKVCERNRGLLLAQALLAEILQQAYEDPAFGPGSFGVGADEVTGNRSRFDDVDDYHGWVDSPPENKDGSLIPWADGYERRVRVAWVDPGNPLTVSGTSTGVKSIQVTVMHQERVVCTLWALRSTVWLSPSDLAGGSP